MFFAAQIKKAPRPGCRRGRPCLLCLPFSIAAKRGCPSWAFPSLRHRKVTTFPPFLQIFPNLLIPPKAPSPRTPAIAIGAAHGFDKSSCLHGYSDCALFFLAELLDLLLLPLPQCVYEAHHPWRGIFDSYVSCHDACFEVSAKIVLTPEFYNFIAEF